MTPAVCECDGCRLKLPCPHARPSWHMCPHCNGTNAAAVPGTYSEVTYTPRPEPAVMVGNDGLYGGSVEVSVAEEMARLKAELAKTQAAARELRKALMSSAEALRSLHGLAGLGYILSVIDKTAFLDGGEGEGG